MTKILQISNYYFPHIGGIEQVAHDISRVIQEVQSEAEQSGNDPVEQKIICFNEDAGSDDIVCKREETVIQMIDGVEIHRCGCFTKTFSQSLSFTFAHELDKIIKTFRPDTIIFHYPNPFQAQFLLPYYLKKDCRFILYWHLDITRQKRLGELFDKQTKQLLQRADQIVATSQVYIDGSPYLSAYHEKCTVIPNCIDENRLKVTGKSASLSRQIRDENKGKIICFGIGRHIPYKGFNYLIEASKQLDDRFRIYIGGRGEQTEELKAQAADDPKITFTGKLSEDELAALYLTMDIFCFPSVTKNEAFGLALAEAMYFGKPAVTFTIPGSGVNFVNLKDVTGLEVENGNSAAYAQALRKLADDEALRLKMGQNAKERVEDLFTYDKFREKIIDVILPTK